MNPDGEKMKNTYPTHVTIKGESYDVRQAHVIKVDKWEARGWKVYQETSRDITLMIKPSATQPKKTPKKKEKK